MDTKVKVINDQLFIINAVKKITIEEPKIIRLFQDVHPEINQYWLSLEKFERVEQMNKIVIKIKQAVSSKTVEKKILTVFIKSNNNNLQNIIGQIKNITIVTDYQNADIILLDSEQIGEVRSVEQKWENKLQYIIIEKNNFILTSKLDQVQSLFDLNEKKLSPFELLKALMKAEKIINRSDKKNHVILIEDTAENNMIEYYFINDLLACCEYTFRNEEEVILTDKNAIYQKLRDFQKKCGYWLQEIDYMQHHQVPYNVIEMKTNRSKEYYVGETPFEAYKKAFSLGVSHELNLISSDAKNNRWCDSGNLQAVLQAKTYLLFHFMKDQRYQVDKTEILMEHLPTLMPEETFLTKTLINNGNKLLGLTFVIDKVHTCFVYQVRLMRDNHVIRRIYGINLTEILKELCIYAIGTMLQNRLFMSEEKKHTHILVTDSKSITEKIEDEKGYLESLATELNLNFGVQEWKYNKLVKGTGIQYINYFWEGRA